MTAQQDYVNATARTQHGEAQPRLLTGRLPVFLNLLLLIAAFRLVALAANATDLFMDEAQYWAWSRDLALGYFSKPPLIAWIIHGASCRTRSGT